MTGDQQESLVVLVCAVHGRITTPIPPDADEVAACTRRHREAGCQSTVTVTPERKRR